MNRRRNTFVIVVFCAIFIAGTILISTTDPFCSENDPEEKAIGPTKTAEVTIEKKLMRSLLTKELHGVRLSRHTGYADQSGVKIAYQRLPVPCKATLVYESDPGGNLVAVSVTVKRLLPGASTAILVVPE